MTTLTMSREILVSRDRFQAMIAGGQFLEWAEYAGHLYGTAVVDTERELESGTDLVLVIEVQGARQVRAHGAGRAAQPLCNVCVGHPCCVSHSDASLQAYDCTTGQNRARSSRRRPFSRFFLRVSRPLRPLFGASCSAKTSTKALLSRILYVTRSAMSTICSDSDDYSSP